MRKLQLLTDITNKRSLSYCASDYLVQVFNGPERVYEVYRIVYAYLTPSIELTTVRVAYNDGYGDVEITNPTSYDYTDFSTMSETDWAIFHNKPVFKTNKDGMTYITNTYDIHSNDDFYLRRIWNYSIEQAFDYTTYTPMVGSVREEKRKIRKELRKKRQTLKRFGGKAKTSAKAVIQIAALKMLEVFTFKRNPIPDVEKGKSSINEATSITIRDLPNESSWSYNDKRVY